MDNIDLDYFWQRRIQGGVRYQKGAVPFPDSVKLGLDFNVASQREEKLDLGLLTNGVLLDICDFAKAVNKSEKFFIHEILDFNFDLGAHDRQCYEFAMRVHIRAKALKDIIRGKHERWEEVFSLTSERPCHCSDKVRPIYDQSGVTTRNSYLDCIASELQKTDSSGATSGGFIIHKSFGIEVNVTEELYPLCKKIGLDLDIRPKDKPKDKLDPDLLTNGVMKEVLQFSKLLCGRHPTIVLELLKHNFDLKNLDKVMARAQITQLMARRNYGITADIRAAFRSEPFTFQSKTTGSGTKWKKRAIANMDDQATETPPTKRKRKPNSHLESFVNFESIAGSSKACWLDDDLSYTCPVDAEGEVQSGPEDAQEEADTESSFPGSAAETESTTLLDVKEDEEDIVLSPVSPGSMVSCVIQGLFSKSTNEDAPAETAKLRLWRRRSARSKQILSQYVKLNDKFEHCSKIGLDFNVGSGDKQNFHPQLLTNGILFEVHKFANWMTKTRSNFLSDILKRNFSIELQDKLVKRNFLGWIASKVGFIQSQPSNTIEFLSSVVKMPEVYNNVTSGDPPPTRHILTEQPTNCHPLLASETSREADMEPYPFCKKMGLNLWSLEERPRNERLDVSLLTNGALLELVDFTKELCGELWSNVYDIIGHNFDLDLQDGKSEAAQGLQKWYNSQRTTMRKHYIVSEKRSTWFETVVQLTPPAKRTCIKTAHRRPCPNSFDSLKENLDQHQLGQDLKEEADVGPCSSFPLCKDIGLDLDTSCKAETKAKLDSQVLTRSVVHELHRYILQNSELNYAPALYEILDYNFDLSSQSHRKWEFAWSLAAQVKAMVGKKRLYLGKKGDYHNKVFELPFEQGRAEEICKEEPDYNYDRLDPDDSDILFVRELYPIDIEVELD